MIDLISRILRGAALAVLALLGLAMALAFMFSTALAVGVLYIIARLRGNPFGIRAYWNQRNQAYQFGSAPFGARPANARMTDVIDVPVRDLH